MSIFERYQARYDSSREEEMSLHGISWSYVKT